MFWLAIGLLTLALLVAPLRRGLLGAWRITVPLVVGGLAGLLLTAHVVANLGFPPWIVLFAVPLLAVWAIGAFAQLLGLGARRPGDGDSRRP